jgi:23S rRNA (cytosine1962-C5)-methyltransferase
MVSNASAAAAVATITRRAADRLRAGHLWVYRSDIDHLAPASIDGGSLVSVVDSRAIPLGTGLYSAHSEIVLRIVSRQPTLSRAQYLAELRDRVLSAIQLRQEVMSEAFSIPARGTVDNACRLIFSEADGLPGIIADRYNRLVILQLLTQGTAQDDVRQALVEVLSQQPWVATIVERPEARMREIEHLAPPSDVPLFAREGEPALQTIFTVNGLHFHFDAAAGQKTGAFLDQRLNYTAAATYAHGKALDICTYQGGFALHLARTCDQVNGVDASRAALEVADRNLTLNPNLRAEVDWIEADAFELLRDFSDAGQRFDTIVLDPPAFAKSKRAAEGALRGYKELNLRAMKMLGTASQESSKMGDRSTANHRAGTLITCSCSHHVSTEDFFAVVRSAAVDAGRRVQLIESRGAAPDHPAILTLPETSYLKCLILRVG